MSHLSLLIITKWGKLNINSLNSARILNSNMPHPRVYDGRICVDILRDFQQYFRGNF